MTEDLVRLRKATKFYGSRLIFKQVTAAVAPGEVLLVAGANGAGKSTLLRAMAGLARLDAGDVEWSIDPGELGYVAHHTFIYPQLSGLENLRFWASMHSARLTDEDLAAVLERVGLSRAAEERAGRYSRGMAQRLSIARAFMLQPRLVLLDEPATGLDRRSLSVLEAEMDQARGRGAGLVWVSHDLERDLPKADTVLALADRKAAYVGPASGFDMSSIFEKEGRQC